MANTNLPPLVKMKNMDFDESMFIPVTTGSDAVDQFISNKGGVLPSTITMVTGGPGAGKTTLMAKWIADIQQHNAGKRCLFISSEMDEIDFAEYYQRFPEFGEITIYFVNPERDLKSDLKALVRQGWDVILMDSFKDIQDKLHDSTKMTKTAAERFLVDLLKKAKMGIECDDGATRYTAFLIIQQVLKSGDFAGSNALKHLVTAALKLETDGMDRYMTYDKNRRGVAGRKLYYIIGRDTIEYDVERRELEELAIDVSDTEVKRQREHSRSFASLDELLDDANREDSAPAADDDNPFDYDVVVKYVSEANGNLAQTLRDLKSDGHVPQYTRYHVLRNYCKDNQIERNTYASSN